jgi:hypothetical protein
MKHLSKATACDASGEKENVKFHGERTFWKWRAQGDDFRTFLGELGLASPQAKIPAGLRA